MQIMAYLANEVSINDKGQRKYCGCIESKDIDTSA